jgi:hypothetical protein
VSTRIAMRTRSTTTDGRWVWMRLHSKKTLRRAMRESAGGPGQDCSSIPKLAQAAGLSTALVGFLVKEPTGGPKDSARWTCTVATAEAISAALGWDLDELFGEREVGVKVA